MGNPHRLMVLCRLIEGEKSVGELERLVGLSQSALSQHLARLRRDSLVKTRRSAQTIFYSLAGNEAIAILTTLHQLYCAEATAKDAPEQRPATTVGELTIP
jgi:DNA-binding transcriptional ArsR family regulator